MRIGVFDSGIGGKAVADAVKKVLPTSEVIFICDQTHVPYGNRKPKEIIELTEKAVKTLIDKGCDPVIIACNTATTNAISYLRETYPDIRFVGIEPMVKPAAKLTRTARIAVCATPATLKSDRYKALKQTWASNVTVFEPDCRDWADLIERGRGEDIDISELVNLTSREKVDVIVLGCTHYHWIKQRILDTVGPGVVVMDPTDSITDRVSFLIKVH